jgi:hypothetical protein
MRATILSLVVTTSLLLAACGQEQDIPGSSQPSVLGTRQSACKANSDVGSYVPGAVKAAAQGDGAVISREDARYNCAAKLKLEATVSGTRILVQETITNPDETARCMCNYDLSVELKGLASGNYTVSVTDADGQAAGSATLTVGGASSKLQVAAKQSACKGNGFDYSAGSLKGSLMGGSLVITHEDARYNCAAKVELSASRSGNDIIVQESISNPSELALCTCDFDLSAEVKGLAAGSYTVKVLDADKQLVGTLQVTIP